VTPNALHITNGDSVVYLLKKAGVPGVPLPWRDVLHEGPVPRGSLEDVSRVRAEYLAWRRYGNPIKINHDFQKRDATLRRARQFDEIILWFEHDLYDQLQVLQLLVALDEMRLDFGVVQMIQSDSYLGPMTADELLALHPKRRSLTAALVAAAHAAWDAFTGDEPTALRNVAQQTAPGLPFLAPALRRLCEEFPAAGSGVSRSERQVLESVAQGARRKEDIFKRANSREEASFLGDTSLFAIVDDLCAGASPLISQLDDGYDVTVLGRRVLAGDADWAQVQPPDKWIGGVHLSKDNDWRWNEITGDFERQTSAV
jgi:hypothetical protein